MRPFIFVKMQQISGAILFCICYICITLTDETAKAFGLKISRCRVIIG